MKEKKVVLITGGAGYIGSILTAKLLGDGYKVRVYDNLMHTGNSVLNYVSNPDYKFIKGDVQDYKSLSRAVENADYVIHLAAIVGDPACKIHPQLAKAINYDSSIELYQMANNMGVKGFIFASTCSNYGKMDSTAEFVSETSPLRPVSLYAETKVGVEKFLLNAPRTNVTKPVCLRFATVYGISPRMRFDLTVNEFTKELALGKELIVFGEQFWRPYIHVLDLAQGIACILKRLQKGDIDFEVFNVGATAENYQKRSIIEAISKVAGSCNIRYVHKDEDPRDYKVSFEKIAETIDFRLTKSIKDGINEIYFAVRSGLFDNIESDVYRNS